MKSKILYIEDEPNLGKIVYDTLLLRDFDVVWEKDGGLVMPHFESFNPDLCVLDIMLPNLDGYSLCEQIRSKYPSLPIIFLTAKTETADLVKGFEAGGTDYMRKPFSIEELIARIQNQLQLLQVSVKEKSISDLDFSEQIEIGKYNYYPKQYELKAPSESIKLSSREGDLLHFLVGNGNHISQRKEILLKIWGDDSFFNSRNLDVYIKKLRNYFKEDANVEIQTLRGKGYLFIVKNQQ
ncbi:MAG: response regulator transcription factor [Labilibaculum sp.]|nr:response regulator transcription factor [Labilibaculum sp.]MBI9058136.1 response regulator transcription factor [Labilibaculum sp.]